MKNQNKLFLFLIVALILFTLSYIYIPKIQQPRAEYEEPLRFNPPPPRNLSGNLMAGSIMLNWNVPETVKVPHNYSDVITHYNIYRGITADNISYIASTSNTNFEDSNISGISQYFYEVTAVHEGGMESAPSEEILIQNLTATPPGLTYQEYLRFNPPPPRNLRGTFMVDSINLYWDVPETVKVPHNYSDVITHYNIYRGTTAENISYLASVSNLYYRDFNISKNHQYIYEVTAVYDGSTEGVPSDEVIVQT